MTLSNRGRASIPALDAATAALVRQSARITAASEAEVREGFAECNAAKVSQRWQEELVLQSYLFAGFPRALNAAREWRKSQGAGAGAGTGAGTGAGAGAGTGAGAGMKPGHNTGEPAGTERSGVASFAARANEGYADVFDWRVRGEETCATVYGEFYEKLRGNIRALSPALDEWMIVEGYGKVLSREGLDLGRRELCIVAACAAAGQERQLHSHLHGALNAGVSAGVVRAALDSLGGVVGEETLVRARLLLARVVGKG
jgi:4-carboxymuconolactone decarboxylase